MPASATLTSFYTFSANTKARASQVNTNFSTFRGHILALDPNLAQFVHNTYDLGSAEYRWRKSYLSTLNLYGGTTTSEMELAYDSATIASEFVFKTAGTERARITNNGFKLANMPSSTLTAGVGQCAQSAVITSVISALAAATIASSKITISTQGRPVELFLTNGNTSGAAVGCNDYTAGTTFNISLLRNGVTITNFQFISNTATASQRYPASMIKHIDFVAAGTYIYELAANVTNINMSGILSYTFLNAIEK